VATEASLSLSETIAKALNIPFGRETTEYQARYLLELYYRDIKEVLPEETRNCQFEDFASRDFVSEAYFGKKLPFIEIDQQWPMFLMDANIIVCIRTFTTPDQEARWQNVNLFKQNLRTLADPHSLEDLNEKFKPLLVEHAELLPAANLLTMAMFGFMLCHELAHHNLGHLDEKQDKQQELDADAKGFEYLTRVSEQFETLQFLKVPPNFLSAPIIGMYYLQILEMAGIIFPAGDTHPSVKGRIKNLTEQFNKIADEQALYLYNGLHLGCEELINEMKKSE